MEKLNQEMKKISLGNDCGCTYGDAAVCFPFLQNPQKKNLRDIMTCVKLFSILKVTKGKQ